MILSRWCLLFTGPALLGGASLPAGAQTYFAVGASATYMSTGSGDFEFAGSGFGVAGQGRIGRGWVSVGLGATYMNFPIEARAGDFDLSGVYIEPRLTLESVDPDGEFRPYVFGRVSWLSQDGTLDRTPLTGDARVLGGGAGALLRITPLIWLDFGGNYSAVDLTGRTFDGDPRPDESGASFGAHIGAYLRFGGDDGGVIELNRRSR